MAFVFLKLNVKKLLLCTFSFCTIHDLYVRTKFNPRRACATTVTVVGSVCLFVCQFVGFSLKPLRCRDPALPQLCGQRTVRRYAQLEYRLFSVLTIGPGIRVNVRQPPTFPFQRLFSPSLYESSPPLQSSDCIPPTRMTLGCPTFKAKVCASIPKGCFLVEPA